MTVSAPLLMLGCHRSGTSAVMGLLHVAADLYLGDVLPPGRDNPKGYFESLSIVEAHKHLLSAMDRDWTCPPAYFEPDDGATALIREALAPLVAQPKPWGVKDPRLLFMLPPWTHALPAMRFVGVIRDPGSTAKSIVNRNNIPPEGAGRIVGAYIKRLADLHRLMPFPIIDFGDDAEQMLSRVQILAERMGLEWDEAAARLFLAPSLVHYRTSLSPDENYHYLVEAAKQPLTEPAIYSSDDIAKALIEDALLEMDELPNTYGPRFTERRQSLLGKVKADEDRVEAVLELVPAQSSVVRLPPGRLNPRAQVKVAGAGSIQRSLRDVIPPSHIVAPGILDILPQDQFAVLLSDLDLRTRTHAVLHLDGPKGSRAVVEAASEGTSWILDNVEATVGDREILTVSKTADVFRQPGGIVDSERMLLSIDARLSALERDAAMERETRIAARASEEMETLTKENQKLERRLATLASRYERLANRRSVRAALRLASLFRPFFKSWRRR